MRKGILAVVIAAVGAQAVPSGQSAQPARDAETRRDAIRIMEAVLSSAVLRGAEQLAKQLGGGNPNISFFTGQARSHGFILDGYGVFFHVEIPEMQSSLVMSVTTLERDLAVSGTLESLRRAMAAVPDSAGKLQAEEAIKRLQLQIGPLPPLAQAAGQQPASGYIRATDTPAVADLPPQQLPFVKDPRAVYREAIKSALIGAMLDYSRGMNIQADEWLSVAAHRGESPLSPDEIVTSSTVVLRIKGSDLAIYEADRSQKEEIRKRVEVREF